MRTKPTAKIPSSNAYLVLQKRPDHIETEQERGADAQGDPQQHSGSQQAGSQLQGFHPELQPDLPAAGPRRRLASSRGHERARSENSRRGHQLRLGRGRGPGLGPRAAPAWRAQGIPAPCGPSSRLGTGSPGPGGSGPPPLPGREESERGWSRSRQICGSAARPGLEPDPRLERNFLQASNAAAAAALHWGLLRRLLPPRLSHASSGSRGAPRPAGGCAGSRLLRASAAAAPGPGLPGGGPPWPRPASAPLQRHRREPPGARSPPSPRGRARGLGGPCRWLAVSCPRGVSPPPERRAVQPDGSPDPQYISLHSKPNHSALTKPSFARGEKKSMITYKVVTDKQGIQKKRDCFGMTAVELPGTGLKGTNEGHDLFLTSAAPDVHGIHSLFALIPSWTKKILFKRESTINQQLLEGVPRISVSSGYGITLQKCAVVATEHDLQTAYVRLLINNTNTPSASNVTDLILLDNITGLHVQGTSGNKTTDGFQIYKRGFLQVGEYYSVNYIAFLDTKETWDGKVLTLPAKLTFSSSSLNKTQHSLTASFTITGEEKTKILYSHGIHASGFFVAFVISFVLTCVAFFAFYQTRRLKWSFLNEKQEIRYDLTLDHKLEYSQFNSGDPFNEDIIMNDQIIEILAFEDSKNMLQALEDLKVANLTRADADLEAYRMQMCKEVIAVLMKNMVFRHNLSPNVEKRMGSILKKQFFAMENEVQEEYARKMVALTAECNLETRKEMEAQHQRERAANDEAEELIKRLNEKSAIEYRCLLEKIHKLEQNHMKRFLLVRQEEYFAKAYRQLAIFQRTELHNVFFTQIKNAIFKGELKLEAAKALVQDYSKIQEDIEELMDFLQANKKYHLSKRFAYREYLINNIHLWDSQASSLLNTAASQITSLINKTERAGHLSENHLGTLLDQAQTEVHSVKQKLDHNLKQEKQRLHQKLVTKRRREMLQKQKEQRKEQMSIGDTFKTTKEVSHYLSHWQKLLTDHAVEFEELIEKLDNDASEEIKVLRFTLTEKAIDELKRIQYGVITQELLKLNVPKPFLQQIVEEHKKEIAIQTEQLEKEEHDKNMATGEWLENTRQKLSQELEHSIAEQKKLRSWEQLVFKRLLSLPLSLSEEELLRMRQEFHCCYSQMDNNLALPKIRKRALLQAYQSAWREAELLKVDQNSAVSDKQPQPNIKKQRSKNRNKIDVLKKSLEDKIRIYEELITDENLSKVHNELLLEKENQLHSRENKLGESIAALQFQKTDKKSKTLEIYTAIISVQALLLEELSTSKILSESECTQILEAHNPEIEELDRKLEYEMLHKETAQQQHLLNRQRWTPDGLGLSDEVVEINVERRVSALLCQALNKCKQLVNLHQQSLQEEQWNDVVLEDLLENIEMDTFLALYSQELRLATYLTKLTMVPVGMLHRLLNLLLPSSSQTELLSVLDSISDRYSDSVMESDINVEEADSCRKRKHQGSWQALESKVRQDLISKGLEKMHSANRSKESLLKKKQLALMERTSFSPLGCLSRHPPVEPFGQPDSLNTAAAEAIELLDTGEKIFLFRDERDPILTLHSSPRKKKKNFLNSKKTALANTG
ncbi:limbin isoform X5 [Mauremys reevesii]|uniref:limbin isoform X5 n=1 Tax=Mauremys reevesii TaxID=260615 RepID=UPI00193EEFC2|nr:limbin isoform X5 [Mauremys reevesii]